MAILITDNLEDLNANESLELLLQSIGEDDEQIPPFLIPDPEVPEFEGRMKEPPAAEIFFREEVGFDGTVSLANPLPTWHLTTKVPWDTMQFYADSLANPISNPTPANPVTYAGWGSLAKGVRNGPLHLTSFAGGQEDGSRMSRQMLCRRFVGFKPSGTSAAGTFSFQVECPTRILAVDGYTDSGFRPGNRMEAFAFGGIGVSGMVGNQRANPPLSVRDSNGRPVSLNGFQGVTHRDFQISFTAPSQPGTRFSKTWNVGSSGNTYSFPWVSNGTYLISYTVSAAAESIDDWNYIYCKWDESSSVSV